MRRLRASGRYRRRRAGPGGRRARDRRRGTAAALFRRRLPGRDRDRASERWADVRGGSLEDGFVKFDQRPGAVPRPEFRSSLLGGNPLAVTELRLKQGG